MNPIAQLSDMAKLIMSLIGLLLFAVFAWWIVGKFSAANTLANIKQTGKVLAKDSAKRDKANAVRDAAINKSDAAIQKQIDAMKDDKNEVLRAELDRPLHPDRVRLINCAIRGAERESDCGPQNLR